MTTSKKIFISSLVAFAILLIFLGIYNLSFKKNTPANQSASDVTNKTAADQQKAAPIRVSAITDEAVLSPILDSATSKIKYYSKLTGQVYQIDLDGSNKKTLAAKTLPGLSDVAWSPDGTKTLTTFSQSGLSSFFYYDYATDKGVKLKDNLDTVIWQNNNKIFYKYYNPETGERSLNIADPDGNNWSKIANLDYKYVSIAPISRTALVSFWNSPDAAIESVFESAPILGGDKTLLLRGIFGADYRWNNNSSSLLISHSNEKNGSQIQLATANDHGGELKNLGIPTFVSKSAWSKDNKTVYYALPASLPNDATLPNDYLDNKFTTNDSFWKIDTTTGSKTNVLGANQLPSAIDATNLFLNADESILFFINKLDGRLYKISL
ncbi:MAG: hypothetical protein WC238_04405 [Parcubacteria group bacterium]|jgi:hypothetical protein